MPIEQLEEALKEAESFSFGDFGTVFSTSLSPREGSRWGLGGLLQRKDYKGLSWDEAVQEAKKLRLRVLDLLQNSWNFSYGKTSDVSAVRPDSWNLSQKSFDPYSMSTEGLQTVVRGFYRHNGASRLALRATINVEPNNIDKETINQQDEFTAVAHIDFAQGTLNTEEVLKRINKYLVFRERVFGNSPVREDDYAYIALWGRLKEFVERVRFIGKKRTFGDYSLYNELAWVSAFGGNAKVPPVYR